MKTCLQKFFNVVQKISCYATTPWKISSTCTTMACDCIIHYSQQSASLRYLCNKLS